MAKVNTRKGTSQHFAGTSQLPESPSQHLNGPSQRTQVPKSTPQGLKSTPQRPKSTPSTPWIKLFSHVQTTNILLFLQESKVGIWVLFTNRFAAQDVDDDGVWITEQPPLSQYMSATLTTYI